jgi:hypothetical protein
MRPRRSAVLAVLALLLTAGCAGAVDRSTGGDGLAAPHPGGTGDPVDLAAPLGQRVVVNADGAPVPVTTG